MSAAAQATSAPSGAILSEKEFNEALKTVKLSEQTIKTVQATAAVVAEHALEITKVFYPLMFKNNPEALQFFNESNQEEGMQQEALAHAVVGYASNIDKLENVLPLVDVIAQRHVALSVTGNLYSIVYTNLMQAIAKVLGSALTPAIVDAWSEAVIFLSKVLIDAEKDLANRLAAREGGWLGEREFKLVEKTKIATDVIRFSFTPADEQQVIDFTPGQYITIRCEGFAPRHYTITSAPGSSVLQCTTRLVSGGKVSTFMHETMKEGDTCLLGVPCGLFTVVPTNKAILISAGIGITPIYAFYKALEEKNILALLHFENSADRVAYKAEFEQSGLDPTFIYTKDMCVDERKVQVEKQIDELIAKHGTSADFYVCAPKSLNAQIIKLLTKQGAKNVFSEIYGTGTTPLIRCPASGL